MSNPFTTKDPLFDIVAQVLLGEKKLTDAELKKREEIVLAIKRENPDMEKSRAYAIATAQAKKVAEEVEQIDEIHSPGTKVRIPHKGKMVTGKVVRHDKGSMGESPAYVVYVGEYESAKVPAHKVQKVNEEVEQIDETGDTLKGQIRLRDYKEKAKKDMGDAGEKLWYKSVTDNDSKGKLALIRQRDKRRKGIQRADARIKTEEVEVNEAEDTQQNMLLRAMAQDPSDLMKMKRALKAGDKALTNPILRQEILKMLDQMMSLTTTDKSLLQRTRMGFQKAKTMKMPEEVQLEAIGAKDKQDEGEYGYEGDMAMSQLRTIIRNCEEMMKVLDKETDLPEWVQSKITLATDYLQTANDYLMSELEEEVTLDEVSRVYEPITKKMVARKPIKVQAGGGVTRNGVPVVTGPSKHREKMKEEVELDEAKKTTHEDPLITVHKDGRLQAHAHLSTINDIHGTSVKHTAIHAGGAKVKTKYGDNLEYKLSRHHAQGVEESVGSTPMNPSYRKIPDMVAKDAPFEGGREVKSTKSAAERVKKIAKGMEKHYNKDKK